MATYLSIDVDYWQYKEYHKAKKQLENLLQHRRNIPTIVVMNHQQLLPYVNSSGADTLVNIDEHSDLCSRDVNSLDCGSWVSFVKWRHSGRYMWYRNRHNDSFGNCNLREWNYQCQKWDGGSDWKKTSSVYDKSLKIDSFLKRCVGIGICISPGFCSEWAPKLCKDLVHLYGLDYRKGRMNENYRRWVRPTNVRGRK